MLYPIYVEKLLLMAMIVGGSRFVQILPSYEGYDKRHIFKATNMV